jgi:hypothetical protein
MRDSCGLRYHHGDPVRCLLPPPDVVGVTDSVGCVVDADMVERITAGTRAALDAAAYERAWAAGRLLPLEEAVAEALAVAEEVLTKGKG